jgi:hypothetical protein
MGSHTPNGGQPGHILTAKVFKAPASLVTKGNAYGTRSGGGAGYIFKPLT